MPLKGIDIFKLSPKKNCKECGCNTCMAFCMQVAQGTKALEECPYFSEEAMEKLAAQSAPPMKTVVLGDHKLGGETVLFRHEKALVNPNLYAVSLSTDLTETQVDARLETAKQVDYLRIGQRMRVEAVWVENRQSDPAVYKALVAKAAAFGGVLVLCCRDVDCARAALEVCGRDVILNGATPDNYAQMAALAKEKQVILGVWAADLSALYDTVKALEGEKVEALVLDLTAETPKKTLENAVQVRRSAILDGERSLGYPVLVDVSRFGKGHVQTAYAAMFTEKYASLVAVDTMDYARALPLYGLRQNLYTDPQKPMKVEAKCYPLNGGGADAPVVLTVDFALTYFLVAGEVERSGMPVNLAVCDASGMSVLTAWAAGKFSATTIAKALRDMDLHRKIRCRTLIIPGKVAVMRQEIRQALPGWDVVTGPQEAAELPKYLREKAYEAAVLQARQEKEASVDTEDTRGLSFTELLATKVPPIQVVDMGVRYKGFGPNRFVIIGERIHCIAPGIRAAMDNRDPKPILERAAQQIAAGATYLDVNIGPAESDGPERMMWAVKLLQENFDGVPLALDTTNVRAIEAGIRVYDRRHGKPIINSADAGSRMGYIDLAAANDAICIALCSADGIARDNDQRMGLCEQLLERGLGLGMDAQDLWFDPQFLVVKGMQDKQMEVLEAIRMFSEKGLKSTGGLSNNSNGAPKSVRPVMDAALMAMCMMQGMTSAIVNPNDRRLMETIRTCEVIRNQVLYSDSYLEEI